MPGEGFFMAMGGLGVSLAGFAGLISALDRRPISHSPVGAYRITGIVFNGFWLTIAGFGTVAAYTISGGDLTVTVRAGTLLLVGPQIRGFLQMRPGSAWPSERERWFSIAVISGLTAITLGNLIVASLGYLQFLMLTALVAPLSIFYNTVRDAARGDAAATDPVPTETHPA